MEQTSMKGETSTQVKRQTRIASDAVGTGLLPMLPSRKVVFYFLEEPVLY